MRVYNIAFATGCSPVRLHFVQLRCASYRLWRSGVMPKHMAHRFAGSIDVNTGTLRKPRLSVAELIGEI
jgi:hypothetical protein